VVRVLEIDKTELSADGAKLVKSRKSMQ
jgi:hypothetical protein